LIGNAKHTMSNCSTSLANIPAHNFKLLGDLTSGNSPVVVH